MLRSAVHQGSASDSGRLGELYARHADAAIRLAYLLTGDCGLAEDLVQDAFVRLAGRLVHLRDPGAFEAYLRTTVINLSRSHFRRKKVERAYLVGAKTTAARNGHARLDSSLEERDELWRALDRLTSRQRVALVLRFYEDLSERDIADLMRCRPGTVKSLISRGLEALRSEIRGEDR